MTLFKCHHPALKYAFKITVVATRYKVLGEKKEAVEADFCLIGRHALVHWAPGGDTEAGFTSRSGRPSCQGGTTITTGGVVPLEAFGSLVE